MKKLILFILLSLCVTLQASSTWSPGIMTSGTSAAANGLVGNSASAGASAGPGDGIWYWTTSTSTAAGTVRYIHAYVEENEAGTSSACFAIWNDNGGVPGTQVGSCSITWEDNSIPGWQYCDMGSDKTITNATTYHVGMAETAGVVSFYKTGDGSAIEYDIGGYSACTDANLTDDGDTGTQDMAIFVDNVDQAGP